MSSPCKKKVSGECSTAGRRTGYTSLMHSIGLKTPLEVESTAFDRAPMTWKSPLSTHRSTAYQPCCRRGFVSEYFDTTFRSKVKPSPIAIDDTPEQSSGFRAGFGVEMSILVATAREERDPSHRRGEKKGQRKGTGEGGKEERLNTQGRWWVARWERA